MPWHDCCFPSSSCYAFAPGNLVYPGLRAANLAQLCASSIGTTVLLVMVVVHQLEVHKDPTAWCMDQDHCLFLSAFLLWWYSPSLLQSHWTKHAVGWKCGGQFSSCGRRLGLHTTILRKSESLYGQLGQSCCGTSLMVFNHPVRLYQCYHLCMNDLVLVFTISFIAEACDMDSNA